MSFFFRKNCNAHFYSSWRSDRRRHLQQERCLAGRKAEESIQLKSRWSYRKAVAGEQRESSGARFFFYNPPHQVSTFNVDNEQRSTLLISVGFFNPCLKVFCFIESWGDVWLDLYKCWLRHKQEIYCLLGEVPIWVLLLSCRGSRLWMYPLALPTY